LAGQHAQVDEKGFEHAHCGTRINLGGGSVLLSEKRGGKGNGCGEELCKRQNVSARDKQKETNAKKKG